MSLVYTEDVANYEAKVFIRSGFTISRLLVYKPPDFHGHVHMLQFYAHPTASS